MQQKSIGIGLSLLVLGFATPAAAWTFEKIADQATPQPGAGRPFQDFENPVIDGDTVAFWGSSTSGSNSTEGVYRVRSGELSVVADWRTPPVGSGSFDAVSGMVSVDAPWAAFLASAANDARRHGIYTDAGGALREVVHSDATIPGTSQTFRERFGAPAFLFSLDGNRVGFTAFGLNNRSAGLLAYVSTPARLEEIVGPNTPVAGLTPPAWSAAVPVLRGGAFVFHAHSSGAPGSGRILRAEGGRLSVVVDSTTGVPGTGGTFSEVSEVFDFDGSEVAFRAADASGKSGIYATDGSRVRLIADESTGVPGIRSRFRRFDFVSIDAGSVAFEATDESDATGIYLHREGILERMLRAGDALDGKRVASLGIGLNGLSDSRIVFSARFEDGSRGIYVGTAPAASSSSPAGPPMVAPDLLP